MLNSCVIFFFITSSTETVRNEIKRENPEVTAVGVITDWTYSDNNYIAVELKLENDKTLFLTLVNWRKKPDRETFYVGRVGNYAFAKIRHLVNKETNQSRVVLRTEQEYSLPELSAKTGSQINTMSDIIKYYDEINVFVESLPTVSEDNYQELFEEGVLVKDGFRENEFYFITTYHVKTIWDDKYYGTKFIDGEEQLRKPDYDNNIFFTGLRVFN